MPNNAVIWFIFFKIIERISDFIQNLDEILGSDWFTAVE